MERIDLHIHTSESDGTDTPEQLIKKAVEENVMLLSITDHNTISGYQKLAHSKELKEFPGRIIPGVEFCTNFNSLLIEVLGYGFDLVKMQKYINRCFNPEDMDRKERSVFEIIKKEMLKRGFKLDPELEYIAPFATEAFEKELWRYPENLARFPEELVKYPEMLYRYMNDPDSELYTFDSYFPPLDEVVAGIHEAGGLAFLAHPFTYLVDDPGRLTENAVTTTGLDGLEVFYALHSQEAMEKLLSLAHRYGLYVSGGSDYHGKNKPHIKLGRGLGDLSVPKEFIDIWVGKIS